MSNETRTGEITKEQVTIAKKRMFLPEVWEEQDDEHVLGTLVSQYLEWDGAAIMHAFLAALEDANFHKDAAKIRKMFPLTFGEVTE